MKYDRTDRAYVSVRKAPRRMLRGLVIALSLGWSPWAAAEAYVLEVAGMACRQCAHAMERRLEQVEGVEEARVDLRDGRTVLRTREGRAFTEAEARKLIESVGFRLIGFSEATEDRNR
jgi:copper chaperone CopZ